jgi:hypothetical protein
MKNHFSLKSLLLFIAVIALTHCTKKQEVPIKQSIETVLFQLDSALIQLQNPNVADTNFGGIWCPHCRLYHTRAAEAVYPFSYRYHLTGEKIWLNAAINLGNWLIKQQFPDGSWKETPEEWTGTTTDQLLMMALSYQIIDAYLTETEKKVWLNSLNNAGEYLVQNMSPEFASINYVATTTATLMVLNTVSPDKIYTSKARKLAWQVLAKMDDDNFITGEGGRVFDAKYGVDLVYNMEMSLWGLGLYASLSGDTAALNKVLKSTDRHLQFIFPNGSIDGSWGIRSNKWTCAGGATSDGIQVLFSLLSPYDNRYLTAAWRNLSYLQTCMKMGLVGYGPLHWEIMEDPCIYSTFAKAKNMAMAHSFLKTDKIKLTDLPSDKNGLTTFPTLNLATVRTDNFCATITAYGYKDPKGENSKYMFRPTGGAISNLWIRDYGLFQASSQTEYHRWEPMHFPEAEKVESLTPRIEFENEKGYFTNLFEFDATTEFKELPDKITAEVHGELKNRKQEAGGIGYSYRYIFTKNELTKKIKLRYHSITDTIIIVEPLIDYKESSFVATDNKTISIKKGDRTILFELISGNASLSMGENAGNYWSPYPALKAYPLVLNILPDSVTFENEISFRLRIIQ